MDGGNLTGPAMDGDKVGVIFIAFISPRNRFSVIFFAGHPPGVLSHDFLSLLGFFLPLLKVAGHSFYCSCHTFIVLLIKLVCSKEKTAANSLCFFLTGTGAKAGIFIFPALR